MDWIKEAKKEFRCGRPELFTDVRHCEECKEHNEALSKRDVESIGLEELGNPGWDPMCFITDEGYEYYFPAIVRLCLNSNLTVDDYYIGQFLFQITYEGKNNRHLSSFNASQKSFVYRFCGFILEEMIDRVRENGDEDILEMAIALWSKDR